MEKSQLVYGNRRAVILGNGPSLREFDFESLDGVVTFGSNRIYLAHTPDVYAAVNPLVLDQFWDEIAELDCLKFIPISHKDRPNKGGKVIYIDTTQMIPGFYDPIGPMWEGHTVTFVLMQLAYYLGIKDVALVGVDHYYGDTGKPNQERTFEGPDRFHFAPNYFSGYRWHTPDLKKSELAYSIAKAAYDKAGVRIVNCGCQSRLDIFNRLPYRHWRNEGAPRVSAIVSAYNTKHFLDGCIENLAEYDRDELEIIVVCQSKSPEERISRSWAKELGDMIKVIVTFDVPTVYGAWNIGIRAARGRYLTNANTDDRKAPGSLSLMAEILDSRPDIDVIYPDCYITWDNPVTYADFESKFGHDTLVSGRVEGKPGVFGWPEYSKTGLQKGCFIGPMPLWRASLHQKYGAFNDAYKSAGDYEFWLRVAGDNNMLHLPYVAGVYCARHDGLELADPDLSFIETIRAKAAHKGGPRLFFSIPIERCTMEPATRSLIKVGMSAGFNGWEYIETPYGRTDTARNNIVEMFLNVCTDPNDALVMLDSDHDHPKEILERLASWPTNHGVIAALAFNRGDNNRPVFYNQAPDGLWETPVNWERGIIKADFVGTGAVLIRRWVFDRLIEAGFEPPFFEIDYKDARWVGDTPGEDYNFAKKCKAAGVQQYMDTTFYTPHIGFREIGPQDWWAWCAENKEELLEVNK